MLDAAIQTRNALNSPTYCEDNFDTITEQQLCRKRLPQQKQQADQDIANIRQEIALCDLFGGTWTITVDQVLEGAAHAEGTIVFTGPLYGTITLNGESHPFIGTYTASTQAINFRRSFTLAPPKEGESAEVYTGQVDFSMQPPTMTGDMEVDPGPEGVTDLAKYRWSAQQLS
jgi:hypothetical protein